MEAKHSKSSAGKHAGDAAPADEKAPAAHGRAAAEQREERPAEPQEGSVRYLDGKGLRRPLDPPSSSSAAWPPLPSWPWS